MKLLVSLILLFPFVCKAQFQTDISSDRPGQAISALTAGKNILQIQSGMDVSNMENNNLTLNTLLGNMELRYGLTRILEISTMLNYQKDKFKNASEIEGKGISDLHFGFRVHITDHKGMVPSTSFQMRLKMPDISQVYGSEYMASIMTFSTYYNLSHNMGLTSNWGISWSGNPPHAPTGHYVVNYSFPLGGNFSGFLENYGQLFRGNLDTHFDGGIAYLINSNFQLDLFGGFGINDETTSTFLSTGISWRIHNKNK